MALRLGDQPSSVDATAYAFTHGVLAFPGEHPVKDAILATPGLGAYVERITALAWPDAALVRC